MYKCLDNEPSISGELCMALCMKCRKDEMNEVQMIMYYA